jgi:hypothetical protein
VRVVRRDNGAKVDIPVTNLVEEVKVLLDEIQKNLFKTAQEKRDACVHVVNTWDEFTTALNNKKLILAPWCDEEVLEVVIFLFIRFVCCPDPLFENLGNNQQIRVINTFATIYF